jgi:hypothetical protein
VTRFHFFVELVWAGNWWPTSSHLVSLSITRQLSAAQVNTTQRWLSVTTQIKADPQQLFPKSELQQKKSFSVNYSNHKSDANYRKSERNESKPLKKPDHKSETVKIWIVFYQWMAKLLKVNEIKLLKIRIS